MEQFLNQHPWFERTNKVGGGHNPISTLPTFWGEMNCYLFGGIYI